jgi:hypothetical protein
MSAGPVTKLLSSLARKRYGCFQLRLAASGDENICTFRCEPLCRRQDDATVAAGMAAVLSSSLPKRAQTPREVFLFFILNVGRG